MRNVKIGDFRVGNKEREFVNDILDSNWVSEGKYVKKFEERWANYIGTKYSVLCNSGTSALIAAILALKIKYNIKEGSKVITTPLTYIATSNAIVHNNLEPVFVDVGMEDFCIDTQKIEECLEVNDTSIILPVHLMGYSADMDKINALAGKYNSKVIEDSAEAHGTLYKHKRTGSMSDASIFSYYIAHNIQVGELGAINTNDYEIANLIRRIKVNGRIDNRAPLENEKYDPRFMHDIIGYNFKAMEFQAAFACSQLMKVDWILKRRQDNVKYLNEGLSKYDDVLQLPRHSEDISYLAYPLVIKKPEFIKRKKITMMLEKNGIETRPLFMSIPTHQPAYSFMKKKYEGKLPNAEYLNDNAFYIGIHQFLEQDDLDYIIRIFKEIIGPIS